MSFRFRSVPDGVLAARVADGDRGAFRRLHQRLRDPVETCVRTSVTDPAEVAAIVSATFVEVWWMARHHRGADVRGWVLGIAARRSAEHRRGPATSAVQPSDASRVALAQLLGGKRTGLVPAR